MYTSRALTMSAADAYLASMWRSSFGGAGALTLAIPFVIMFSVTGV